MAECGLLETCIFFNDRMERMPSTAQMLKRKYCRGAYAHCARYMVCRVLGREKVPKTLFPHMLEMAEKILSRK